MPETPPSERNEAFSALDGEREYQEAKWGDNSRATIGEFLLYMQSYLREAEKNLTGGSDQGALEHLRKVTALGVAAMEQHGAPRRDGFPGRNCLLIEFRVANEEPENPGLSTITTDDEGLVEREVQSVGPIDVVTIARDAMQRGIPMHLESLGQACILHIGSYPVERVMQNDKQERVAKAAQAFFARLPNDATLLYVTMGLAAQEQESPTTKELRAAVKDLGEC